MSASYASVYRLAVREAKRNELAQALGEIESAKYAVIGRFDNIVYWYGDKLCCENFVAGIERDAEIVPMTGDLKEKQSAGKVRAYGVI